MQNIIISHSHWRNIIDHTIFVGQNNLTDRESWSVGSCTDGWEFDTENYHRLLILFLLQIFYSTEIWTMPKSPVSLYSMKSQINCQRYELGVRGCLGSCNVSGFNHLLLSSHVLSIFSILNLQSIFFLGAVPGMLFFGWFWCVKDQRSWNFVQFSLSQRPLWPLANHHHRQLDCFGHRSRHAFRHRAYILLCPQVIPLNICFSVTFLL